jgi:ABC-type protease/lipase transport system fused ATPase/permease subunit
MRNGIAVIVAHRPSALAAVDMVLALKQGKVAAFGPRDQVVRPAVPEAPLIRRPEPIIQELVN